MSTPEYRAAPALMAAVREALALCLPMWPRALAALTQQSQASHDWLTHYARACGSADHDLIVEAARRWCASEQFAPKPADLGKLARELTAQRRGSAPTPVAPDVPADLLDGARPFWFAKAGAEEGPYRLDADRAIGMAVVRGALAGGSLGISEGEMDQLQAGAIPWGWLTPLEVPKPAVPAGWHERTLSRGRAA
jgi:hypothetical protein